MSRQNVCSRCGAPLGTPDRIRSSRCARCIVGNGESLLTVPILLRLAADAGRHSERSSAPPGGPRAGGA
jgi:hypothetical protein